MTMDCPDFLCCSTKVVEYLPNVCLIEGCLDYLYVMLYGLSLWGTHWVSAVVVVALVVVVVDVVVVVVVVVVAVVVPAIWRRPAVACNGSQQRQGRAALI